MLRDLIYIWNWRRYNHIIWLIKTVLEILFVFFNGKKRIIISYYINFYRSYFIFLQWIYREKVITNNFFNGIFNNEVDAMYELNKQPLTNKTYLPVFIDKFLNNNLIMGYHIGVLQWIKLYGPLFINITRSYSQNMVKRNRNTYNKLNYFAYCDII